MKQGFLLLLLLITSFSSMFAGELVVKGKYNGKNVFVRNPYNNTAKVYCTNKVFVNDRLIFNNPELSAYQIDLSHLALGDLVVLRIEYKDDCEPVVLNPQAISFTSGFQFITAQSDNNSILWSTKGEYPNGTFEIEQLTKKKGWITFQIVDGKGEMHNNQYSIEPKHFPGENHYRLKYTSSEGKEFYSIEFAFTSTDEPITFTPEKVTSKITLSKPTEYFITDMNGTEIRKGKGKEIFLQDLNPGEYFLHIENRAERFIKK